MRLIECVPNFSEGNDLAIIKAITDAIESVEDVKLLNVDPGKATNRTVVTFVGEPEALVEAAFRGIKKASELIDMRKHKGEHPRMGATDVCPLIPISGVTMEEAVQFAKQVGKRVGEELSIPVYLYEYAATAVHRKNLSVIREGEYEGIAEKIKKPEWKPDFGVAQFNPKSGSTVIGARDFLVAYNVNLNTTSVKKANSVAFDVRENGRVKKNAKGEIEKDPAGNAVRIPGACKAVKAIGWFIEEYGIAQVSINLTNLNVTPVHVAFDEVCKSAEKRGLRVTGSELIGLIPLKSMFDAGKYFLRKQQVSVGVSDEQLIKIAVKSLGLDELTPFDPKKKIIEYMLEEEQNAPLVNMNLRAFANETASESPAPGGGSIAAYVGSLGVSLATMVANLSAGKKEWETRTEEFSAHAEKGQALKEKLLKLVDEDTKAFNAIMAAYQLPKGSQERKDALQKATRHAIEVPFEVMKTSLASFDLIQAMAENGNQNSISDAGVGALCARTAVLGAWLNVKINVGGLDDKEFVKSILAEGEKMAGQADVQEKEILKVVASKISS
ncbi:MAG: glutamate formimidoyltransferase [Chitinophagales bacterium]|nr:glutamate formimidoyltransferase [Chitinophagales bacterium]